MNGKTLFWIVVILLVVLGGIYWFSGRTGGSLYSPPISSEMSSPTSVASEAVQIMISSSGFSPGQVVIKTGTKVTWNNQSGSVVAINSAVHPTHLLYPPLNLGEVADGSSVELIFDQSGTYKYHNHLNPTQFGTIVVE